MRPTFRHHILECKGGGHHDEALNQLFVADAHEDPVPDVLLTFCDVRCTYVDLLRKTFQPEEVSELFPLLHRASLLRLYMILELVQNLFHCKCGVRCDLEGMFKYALCLQ